MTKDSTLTKGKKPPQLDIPAGLDIDKMLLYGAWTHGMRAGSRVHRLALFSYLWTTKITNQPDETLQGVIEKSAYWFTESKGSGVYFLKPAGLEQCKEFGEPRKAVEFGHVFSFYREYRGHKIAVKLDPRPKQKSLVQVDESDINGVQATKFLESIGVPLAKPGTSQPRKILNWILDANNYGWDTDDPVVLQGTFVSVSEEDNELSFLEGKDVFRLHRTKERNGAVIKLAKQRAFQGDERLPCQVCCFSFSDKYGDLGKDFIEAHHTQPLSELLEETETKIEDIALVCSNCHRMLHKGGLTIEDLKVLTRTENSA
jgi:hypothetical protein